MPAASSTAPSTAARCTPSTTTTHAAAPTRLPRRARGRAGAAALFTTSFLIDDFLADNDGFGAAQALLSSASSKTAYGTAFCLARGAAIFARAWLGLTSQANLDFTRALGCYDAVIAYDDLAALDRTTRAVYVDFSGSARCAAPSTRLRRSARLQLLGGRHALGRVGRQGASRELPGPKPTLFFAPAQASKRIEQWGAAGLQQRLAEAWVAFVPGDQAQPPGCAWSSITGRRPRRRCTARCWTAQRRPDGHIVSLAA